MALLNQFRKKLAAGRPESVTVLFNRQIDVAISAAQLANEVCSREAVAEESGRPMKSLRREASQARNELMSSMASAYTVPLEREDIFRASQAVEQIISDLRDVIREMTWWDVDAGKWSKDALAPAIVSLQHLREGIEVKDAEQAEKHFRKAQKTAGELRRSYQRGLTILFEGDLTMTTLKKREILRKIDLIGTHLRITASSLLDGMIKRFL